MEEWNKILNEARHLYKNAHLGLFYSNRLSMGNHNAQDPRLQIAFNHISS